MLLLRFIFHRNTDAKKRHAVTPSNMAKIKAECLSLDDDIRWLVAIIFDSGMRLSEAAGLMIDDLELEEDPLPYINLNPHILTDALKQLLASVKYR